MLYHIGMLEKIKDKLKTIKNNNGWKSLLLIGVCVALLLVDILTKTYEERDGWKFTVIPGFIEVISGSRNPGAAFSFLAEKEWGQIFLIVMTFILLLLLIGFYLFVSEKHILIKISLSLICSGAIGNLIDRIVYREVRDFVEIKMFGSFTSCNFADFWIVFGAIIAIVALLFVDEWAVFPLTKSAKEAQRNKKDGQTDMAQDGENTDDKKDGED